MWFSIKEAIFVHINDCFKCWCTMCNVNGTMCTMYGVNIVMCTMYGVDIVIK
jgi:hypothetical protein